MHEFAAEGEVSVFGRDGDGGDVAVPVGALAFSFSDYWLCGISDGEEGGRGRGEGDDGADKYLAGISRQRSMQWGTYRIP